jgi:selenocysteine lyase/cysteine desulfurase
MPSDRRDFLARLGLGAAALAWPARLAALAARLEGRAGREAGPRASACPPEEDLWDVVRQEFLIPPDRLYLNVGTLGPQPRVVLDAAVEHMNRVAMTYPPGVDWTVLETRLGALLHGDPAGFVFPRNTTEGMSFVANGLELHAGDEVLTTTHEHIGGLCPWQLAAKRHGLVLRQLPLPVPPLDEEQLVDVFRRALTRRTRVISVSHVTFTTGVVMPVRAIVDLARPRGIIVVVDGAHPPGLVPVDLRALDADFYASSPHKWLLAPQGTGLLYLRGEWRTRLWPSVASGDWDSLKLGAQRLNHLGTIDESRLAGLLAAIGFHEAIGAGRVYARIAELRARLDDALRATPGVRVVSPRSGPLVAGMVAFAVERLRALELQQRLEKKNVRTRVIGEYDYGWMRLSPHIYNSPAEVDRAVALIRGELA